MPECTPATMFVWDLEPKAVYYEIRLDNEAGDRALTAIYQTTLPQVRLITLLKQSNLQKARNAILVVVAVGTDGKRVDSVLKNISFDFTQLKPVTGLRIL